MILIKIKFPSLEKHNLIQLMVKHLKRVVDFLLNDGGKMDNIKVSVIVPVYNDEEYIQTSISSIINQEFSETYEIIVVDDGSTDNSLDIAQELLSKADIPYKLVHQRNSGVSVARNHGIEVSRGDYLVFVDSDDYILTNHLSELYNGKTDFTLTQMAKKV